MMPPDQGKTYASFIEAQLRTENELRASVDSRANSALTGATGLVTLVLAVFSVFLGRDFSLGGHAKLYLVLALAALLMSAICALVAALPGKQRYTEGSTMQAFLDNPRWKDDEIDARNNTAYCNLTVLNSLRVGTDTKVKWLIAAGCFQIVATLNLGLCTLTAVMSNSS